MFTFHGLTETGPIREENQDAILLPDGTMRPTGPLFALADGIGGYAHGSVASQAALRALLEACCAPAGRSVPATLKRAVAAANLAVVSEARRLGAPRMGTTLTAACLDGSRLHLAHVGDSRAYLVRPGTEGSALGVSGSAFGTSGSATGTSGSATCLTQDHTVVGDLVRMRVISPGQVRDHARRSVLTRAIGLALFVQPDIFSIDLRPGDRVILCTDGIWSVVQDHEFAHPTADLREYCRALIDLALARGSDDNLSVIAIQVQDVPENGKSGGRWLQKAFNLLRMTRHPFIPLML